MKINLLPIAIKLAKFNERRQIATIRKYSKEHDESTRASRRAIYREGLLHFIDRLAETRKTIKEMEKESRAFGGIFSWN